jgi:hypothetical protein
MYSFYKKWAFNITLRKKVKIGGMLKWFQLIKLTFNNFYAVASCEILIWTKPVINFFVCMNIVYCHKHPFWYNKATQCNNGLLFKILKEEKQDWKYIIKFNDGEDYPCLKKNGLNCCTLETILRHVSWFYLKST